jgi:hypothetical protein
MNARFLVAFLCIASLSTGCIIVGGDGDCDTCEPTRSGDVTFLWTFDQRPCSAVGGFVEGVHIEIPGETLDSNGYYPCNANAVDGITLHNFRPGSYSFTIRGYDGENQTLFAKSGNFTVNGNITVRTDLNANGASPSEGLISWYFPGNITCAQAGTLKVDMSIDGGNWRRLDCSQGSRGLAVSSLWVLPGQHTVQLVAVGSDGNSRYYASGTFTTRAYESVSVAFTLGEVGGMALRWELRDGLNYKDCSQSTVTQVAIHLFDHTTQKYIYGTTGDVYGCADAPVVYRFLTPGQYTVYMYATGPNGVRYHNEAAPTVLQVYPFVHPQTSTTIEMKRVQ